MPIPASLAMFVTKMRKRLGLSVVDTYTLNRVYIMAVTELVKVYGYEEAMKRLFEWGYSMGHAYLLKMEKDIQRFPVSVNSMKFLGRAAWYIFSGNDPEIIVEEHKVEEGSYFLVIVRDKESPWDAGFKLGKKVAYYPAGAYEGASSTFALISGKGRWYAIARNTKSLAAGDPYTEIYTVYVPKGRSREKVMKDFPELFEELSYDFSARLYRSTFGEELT